MDPNHPNFLQYLNDFDPSLINHPQFKSFLERFGENSSTFSPQEPPPHQNTSPNYPNFGHSSQNFDQSTPVYGGSNNLIDEDEEENISETSQYPTEPILSHQLPVPQNQSFPVATNNRDWSIREDEALIAAYFEHCTDAIIGKDQKFADLWRAIYLSYSAAQKSRPRELGVRNLKMLEAHWKRMSADLLVWASALEESAGITGSGYNEADVIKNAHTIFRRSCKNPPRNFKFQDAWEMVNKYPKWRKFIRWSLDKEERKKVDAEHKLELEQENSSDSAKRNRDGCGGSFVSGGMSRPDGVKKAKAKRLGKGVISDDTFSNFNERIKHHTEVRQSELSMRKQKLEIESRKEIRKQRQVEVEDKNLEIQARKHKFDMLQVFMSKTTLTPSEERLKEKLLMELNQ